MSSNHAALVLCLFQSLAGVIFGWGNSEGGVLVCTWSAALQVWLFTECLVRVLTWQFNNTTFKNKFGSCDAAGNCALSITRQSSFTGLLSLGAIFGAVSAGSIADRVRSHL
jgi:SP family sugar:H+ symporter-like MFS transporter